MLNKEDLKLIEEELNKIKEKLDKKVEIKTIDLKGEDKDYDIIFIDSSYTYDVVGPIIYIYARAVGVTNEEIIKIRDFVILEDYFIKVENAEEFEIQRIAEIISKNLEYKLALMSKKDYILLDGSLFSDAILYGKNYKILNEKVMERYEEFRKNFEILYTKNTFSIAKRIVQAKFINGRDPDYYLLISNFPLEEFYTEIKQIITHEKILIYYMYFRPRYADHIYRLEGTTLEIKDIAYNLIKKKGKYPVKLKMAHNLSKIKGKEKEMIERFIKKILSHNLTVEWETH